ncbi:hypothetical protein JJB09_20770 [Rhizobium sp. KVB221]|uniref:Uncharacterized protein n=1 Tax=Rhizobium setariae TaxID=2801340 RepID=A0A937CML1_9HYPH|nr:hypothetical protein [Rhizobium setariae]MBL0374450.1 hypothetical protein [Rhizobium setariae]
MNEMPTTNRNGLIGVATILAATVLLFAAFFGWMHYGSSILLTLASQGLSWCL